MWLLQIDDFILADHGIPPAMLTDKSSHLGFGVDRRSGVSTSVFFGSTAQPASWNIIIQCPDEKSRYELFMMLSAPRNEQVRLVAKRDRIGDDLVSAWAAVSDISTHGSSDNLEVTFESNDSVWISEAATTTSKTWWTPLDNMLYIPVGGNIPTHPIIRLTPLLTRWGTTNTVGWRYRQRFRVTNNASEPLIRYPLLIQLGNTAALVSAGKAQASGNDVRVWLDGLEQARSFLPASSWNVAGATYMWVVLPFLGEGESCVYDLVYGNPNAGPPPVLTYPDIPAFDASASSNTQWIYRTATGTSHAGEGFWYLSSATGAYFADFSVPGSWFRHLEYPIDLPSVQQQSRPHVYGTSGQDHANLYTRRGWPADVYSPEYLGIDEKDPYDTVVLTHPGGIDSVSFGFGYRSYSYSMVTKNVTTTVGGTSETSKVETRTFENPTFFRATIASRNTSSESWSVVAFYNVSAALAWPTIATQHVGVTGFTINAKQVALGLWRPSDIEDIDQGQNRQATGLFKTESDVTVNLNAAKVPSVVGIQGEVEIYEFASEIRLRGGAFPSGGFGEYHTLLIGNAREQVGAGSPHCAVRLANEMIQIDCEAHTHDVWRNNFTERVEPISTHVVRALKGYIHDETLTGEVSTANWLPLQAGRTKLINGTFQTGIDGWSLAEYSTGSSFSASWDTTKGNETPFSLKIDLTGNTDGYGYAAYANNIYYPVNNLKYIELSGSMSISNPNVRAHLMTLYYYDEGGPIINYGYGDEWFFTPDIWWYTKAISVAIPDGIRFFRVCVYIESVVNNATGTAWFDDIRLNDSVLYYNDVSMSNDKMDVLVRPWWVP